MRSPRTWLSHCGQEKSIAIDLGIIDFADAHKAVTLTSDCRFATLRLESLCLFILFEKPMEMQLYSSLCLTLFALFRLFYAINHVICSPYFYFPFCPFIICNSKKCTKKAIYNIPDDLFQSLKHFTFLIISHPFFCGKLGYSAKVTSHSGLLVWPLLVEHLPGFWAQIFAPEHQRAKCSYFLLHGAHSSAEDRNRCHHSF